jgi:hypothetical protein
MRKLIEKILEKFLKKSFLSRPLASRQMAYSNAIHRVL